MHAFCGTGVGDEGYGQQRTYKKYATPAAPAVATAAAAAAAAARLVTASPVMTKSWGLSGGKQLPGERPRKTAETLHTSPQPSRHVRMKGAAPLSGAEEQTARAISAFARYACLLYSSLV
jgi:hypothetical protein